MKNKALAAPYLVWMALFTIVPLAIVAYYAFTDAATGEFTFANIANLGNYMPILIKSIWLALISSLICIVIGYPVAYFIANCKETTQRFLYMLVMLPMCISRSCAASIRRRSIFIITVYSGIIMYGR